jgi:Acyl-CoA synthetases (AMP-forming)/AMP-acid ligases II
VLDPFSLLPLSIAAQGGRIDEFDAQQLVAAGFTLLQRSAPLVRALSGKRAAILLPTSPAFITALAAADGRGAVLINPLATPREVSHEVDDANVGAVFTIEPLVRLLPPDIPRVLLDDAPRTAQVIVGGVARQVDLGSHLGMTIEGNVEAAGSNDEALIVYTSAMAGVPLGAILSHHNILANARSTIAATGTTSADHVLALLPFAHLFGFAVAAVTPLLAAGRVTTMSRFHRARVLESLADDGVTVLTGVPSVFRSLLAVMRKAGAAMPNLRLCVCGGAPLAESLQDEWADATGVELRQGYGLTEAGPVCLFNDVASANARGRLGVPLSAVEVDLLPPILYDALGRPRRMEAPSHDGAGLEICVRGDNVFRGYISRGGDGLPFDDDGWLHTGDLGRRDSVGQITFAGLVKPMFTRNGYNIYPREIERVVCEMPGIETAAVREIPVPDDEPDIALEVTGDTSEKEVGRWCTEQLSVYKRPTRISIRR